MAFIIESGFDDIEILVEKFGTGLRAKKMAAGRYRECW